MPHPSQSHRDGWDVNLLLASIRRNKLRHPDRSHHGFIVSGSGRPPYFCFSLPLVLSPNPSPVISTEAPHSLIVKRAAEKSAVVFAVVVFAFIPPASALAFSLTPPAQKGCHPRTNCVSSNPSLWQNRSFRRPTCSVPSAANKSIHPPASAQPAEPPSPQPLHLRRHQATTPIPTSSRARALTA